MLKHLVVLDIFGIIKSLHLGVSKMRDNKSS
jgi:hypothetical protein